MNWPEFITTGRIDLHYAKTNSSKFRISLHILRHEMFVCYSTPLEQIAFHNSTHTSCWSYERYEIKIGVAYVPTKFDSNSPSWFRSYFGGSSTSRYMNIIILSFYIKQEIIMTVPHLHSMINAQFEKKVLKFLVVHDNFT